MAHLKRLQIALVCVVAQVATLSSARASDVAPTNPCLSAIQRVANETSVPVDVLFGVSLTESGRQQKGGHLPWPWALNHQARGQYFETRNALLNAIYELNASGQKNFDVGCFQINYRWHGEEFRSLTDMTDPIKNTRYAARFLGQLHQELGSWDRAIGAYHSRTQKHAQRYRKIVAKNRLKTPAVLKVAARLEPRRTEIERATGQARPTTRAPKVVLRPSTPATRRLPMGKRGTLFE